MADPRRPSPMVEDPSTSLVWFFVLWGGVIAGFVVVAVLTR